MNEIIIFLPPLETEYGTEFQFQKAKSPEYRGVPMKIDYFHKSYCRLCDPRRAEK